MGFCLKFAAGTSSPEGSSPKGLISNAKGIWQSFCKEFEFGIRSVVTRSNDLSALNSSMASPSKGYYRATLCEAAAVPGTPKFCAGWLIPGVWEVLPRFCYDWVYCYWFMPKEFCAGILEVCGLWFYKRFQEEVERDDCGNLPCPGYSFARWLIVPSFNRLKQRYLLLKRVQ